jgi:hypothetical protein
LRRRGLRDGLRALCMHCVEALLSALIENADEVHDRVRSFDRAIHRLLIADIGLHRMDLSDPAERL